MAGNDADLELVRRSQAGDREAFAILVRVHQDRVFTLARGIVRSHADAADVAQETFIAVLRHLDGFREDAQFTTWLHRIAVRKAYDLLRRRTPELDDGTMLDARPAAVDVVEQGLARSDLLDAIAALDGGFREAVLLVDVLGASIEEAATVLDVAAGTVKSRVFRARGELARRLGTLGYERTSQ